MRYIFYFFPCPVHGKGWGPETRTFSSAPRKKNKNAREQFFLIFFFCFSLRADFVLPGKKKKKKLYVTENGLGPFHFTPRAPSYWRFAA